jgi:hypothetical protein
MFKSNIKSNRKFELNLFERIFSFEDMKRNLTSEKNFEFKLKIYDITYYKFEKIL